LHPRRPFILEIFAFCLIASLFASAAWAADAEGTRTIAELLNPDGSLNLQPEDSGNYDPAGFVMLTEADGSPRFVPAGRAASSGAAMAAAVPADANWDDRFFTRGLSSAVYAIAIDGTDIYIGGSFRTIGDVAANRIAKWDGSSWSGLGGGVDNIVFAIAIAGSNVYAGGVFRHAGGVSTERVAKWDGSSWSALGLGVGTGGANENVSGIAVSGSDVYVGGQFSEAGGATARHIAKWDGSSWSSMGGGVGGGSAEGVLTVAVSGSDVYVGGYFRTLTGGVADYIAKWDGSSWSPLGSGTNSSVNALAVNGGDLYAGGQFTEAGGVFANNVAKWDGSSWSALGGGVASSSCCAVAPVEALAVSGSDLYMVGSLSGGISKWDGSSWSGQGSGLSDIEYGRAVAVSGGNVYAGGSFLTAGGNSARYLAAWDGSAWASLGETSGLGVRGTRVSAFALMGSDVIVAGAFTEVGGVALNNIARWDGTNWSALGSGLTRFTSPARGVQALLVVGSDLYAGGAFREADGKTARLIARWDGSNWFPVGSGDSSDKQGPSINALAMIGSDIYAAGWFESIGGLDADLIARWDGSNWNTLGSGVQGSRMNPVEALAVSGSNLILAGRFTSAGGVSVNNIAQWDGSVFSGLGTGTSDRVQDLVMEGSDLYAGGEFDTAGGVTVNYIAKWDGSSWSALGTGMDNEVEALAVRSGELVATGAFNTAGGVPAARLASWDGSSWSAYGSGLGSILDAHGYGLSFDGPALLVGGNFDTAGENVSVNFAIWNSCGDGTQDAGEACDDGNTTSGDGCYSTCESESEVRLYETAQGGFFAVLDFGGGLLGHSEGVLTISGQTSEDVLLALAEKINASSTFQAENVSAVAIGDRLVTNGLIDDFFTDDPGLSLTPTSLVPSLSPIGIAVLVCVTTFVGHMGARRRYR
jgi:cysteine-rich repeat protein